MGMLIGLTGSFGSGKTTVANMLKKKGAFIIDADAIGHKLLKPGGKTYRAILKRFGKSILRKDKLIDRKKLADLVFTDASKLKQLNRITHPVIIKEIECEANKNRKNKIIVIDAPLLIESGLHKTMDKLILVKTKKAEQINRLLRLKLFSRRQALNRMRRQAPLSQKMALADFIIDNSSSKTKTKNQVEKIWKQLGVCHGCK